MEHTGDFFSSLEPSPRVFRVSVKGAAYQMKGDANE